jgi:hypothetical protein
MPSASRTIWTPLILSKSISRKYYWINREVFVLEKGVLWREGDEGKSARRVVPKMYREQIVKLCHDPDNTGCLAETVAFLFWLNSIHPFT